MKIEVFEIRSKEDKPYLELLEQYKKNPELQALLNEFIIPSQLVLAGDFRLITMLSSAVDMDSINVYLVKDVDNDTFLWVIGKSIDGEKGSLYSFPLLREQSKNLQLAIRSILIEKGIMEGQN